MTQLKDFITRQASFSRGAFGPGVRTEGNIDHILDEIEEIRTAANEDVRALEWVDVALLALDGLERSILKCLADDNKPVIALDTVGEIAEIMLLKKLGINELRDWPNWRTAPDDKGIMHIPKIDNLQLEHWRVSAKEGISTPSFYSKVVIAYNKDMAIHMAQMDFVTNAMAPLVETDIWTAQPEPNPDPKEVVQT